MGLTGAHYRRAARRRVSPTSGACVVWGFLLCTVLAVLTVLAPPLAIAGTETAVALDTTGTLFTVDAQTRAHLGLWPDLYPGFVEARLLRDESGSYVLQIEQRQGRHFVQDRAELRADEVEALRTRISGMLEALGPKRDPRVADARVPLLTVSTAVGLGFYSWGIPVASNLDGRAAVGVGMLGVATSFLGPYLATRNEAVTPGMANLGAFGLTRGIAFGALSHRLVTGPRGDSDARLGAAAVGSALGGAGGYLWARSGRTSAGRAHLIEAMGDLGTLAGVELAIATDLRAGSDEADRGLEYASTLGGAAVGIAAGALRGSASRPTWGDAEVLRTTSLLTQCIFVSAWRLGTDNDPTLAGAALGGSLVGAVLGDRLTDRPDFGASQAILLDLSTIAGGALAAGLVYLVDDDGSNSVDSREYLVGFSAGATAGYALTYAAFSRTPARRSDSGSLEWGLRPCLSLGTVARGRDRSSIPLGLELAVAMRF